MKKTLSLAIFAWLFLTGQCLAHTSLSASTPKANQKLISTPEYIALTFAKPVNLVKVTLLKQGKQKIALPFKPSLDKKKVFTIDAPELSPDEYQVKWRILGGDGHTMTGQFKFTIEAKSNKQQKE